jgi:hypothetical protein
VHGLCTDRQFLRVQRRGGQRDGRNERGNGY